MEAGYIPVVEASSAGHVVPGNSVVAPVGNVIRAPGLKRGKMEEAITNRIKLESVLGLTVGSNAALDCDPNTELVAYPAGCTVVLYNPRKNRQTHVLNASRKSVTCVAFSPDGRYLATGECGHAPAVRVWDLQDPTASGAVQIGEFPGHTHGVSCVAFSTSSKYLVSVGSQHDMIVNVWDWRSNLKLASNKVSSKVKAVSFAENGNYFVTVGFRHVKFWYLEYSRSAKFKEPVPLMGRSAILGEQKDNEFCDVVCGRGEASDSTYAITRSGLLCEFNSRRLLDKWVELRTTSANCMAIGSKYIFIGCAEGIVRCFSPLTLEYVTTLPRTHYLGVDVSEGTNINHMFSQPQNAKYPDAIALTYDERNHKLTCVYNDHSLYVWDVRDIKRVGKSHSALYHSACIWGVDMLSVEGPSASSFITCSSDDTVRFWQINRQSSNIYSNELNKVLYIDQDLKFLKDIDQTACNEKDKSKSYDDKTGVRCVRMSPSGEHIASGDRAGNVWVHARSGRRLHVLEAHDAEVLCLSYTRTLLASASRDRLIHVFRADKGYQILQTLDDHSSSITAVRFISSGSNLQMVSCGADKTILFRQLVTSSEGNMSFARGINISGRSTLYDMEVDAGGRHVLAACQDRSVRVYSTTSGKHTKTFRGTTAEDGTLIKVALDSSGIYLATSSTDKILSVYDYYSGECMATMYGHSEIVTGLRFTPDCQHLISASGDGCIFVWRVPHDMVVTMKARLAQQRMRQGKKVVGSNGMSGLDSETDSYLGSPPREIPYEENKFPTPVVPDYTLRIGRLPSWAKKSLGDELPSGDTPAPEPPARGKWAKRINQNTDKRVDSDGSKDSSLDSGTDTRSVDKRREFTPKQRPKSLNLSQLSNVEALFRNFDAKFKKTLDILTISPRVDKVTVTTPTRTPEPRSRHHTDDSSLGSFKFEVTVTTPTRTPEPRSRHHTDDSSLGSFKFEDLESTEHDGDIEDISDGERTSSSGRGNRTMYYPANDDTPGEFMVNAMDVEELRQSQRRSKRWKAEVRLDLPAVTGTSLSGSDDDEVSTPSGDNADRNPLSGSCESIDTAGRREKYLKSAFDSLSGAELDNNMPGTTTLSSKHLSRRPITTPLDAEATRRRHDLQRRIQETKRQLDTVGRTNLKSSQSTTDLSYIPEKDCNARSPGQSARGRPVSMAIPSNTRSAASRNHLSAYPADEDSSGMRRAISLSDLAVKPTPAPRSVQGSGKTSSPNMATATKSPSGFLRPAPRYSTKSNMTRSSSVGVLNNQSDSESDPQPTVRGSNPNPRGNQGLMRPTISSMNKAAANVARRRGMSSAYSAVSLTTGGQEGSSSEAEDQRPSTVPSKPAVPPRPRTISGDHKMGRSGSERDLSAKAREVTARLTAPARARTSIDITHNAAPETQHQLSSIQLCNALAEQLTKTASKVVQLYKTLQSEPRESEAADNAALICGLETAMLETQKVLQGAVIQQGIASNGRDALNSLSSNDEGKDVANVHNAKMKLEQLVTSTENPNSSNSALSFFEQYSDILLNMMQSKMVNQFGQSPQSLPPNPTRDPGTKS